MLHPIWAAPRWPARRLSSSRSPTSYLELGLLSRLARQVVLVLMPPLALIFLVLGTIFLGIATPDRGRRDGRDRRADPGASPTAA